MDVGLDWDVRLLNPGRHWWGPRERLAPPDVVMPLQAFPRHTARFWTRVGSQTRRHMHAQGDAVLQLIIDMMGY